MALTAFEAWSASASRAIIGWANPANPATPPTADWAFTRFDHALLAVGAYCVVVVIGLARMACGGGGERGADAKDKKKQTLSEAFAAEPIRYLQLVYNAAQVALCAVMIGGTVYVAVTDGYTLVCNAYKPEGSRMAFWLWVFYLSKIFDFVDTIIMVARGKFEQFTFLHVYHHISIFLMCVRKCIYLYLCVCVCACLCVCVCLCVCLCVCGARCGSDGGRRVPALCNNSNESFVCWWGCGRRGIYPFRSSGTG